MTALRSANMVMAVAIDVEASARYLKYIVDAGSNNAYLSLRDRLPPTHADLAQVLQEALWSVQRTALDNINICDTWLTAIVESTLPDKGNGSSCLIREDDPEKNNIKTLDGLHKLTTDCEQTKKSLNATVRNELMSNIVEAHLIFGGAFYKHFPLGFPKKFKMCPSWRIQQFLTCDNPAIERDPRFLSYVASAMRLKQTNCVTTFKIKRNEKEVEEFIQLANDPKFVETLEQHMKSPNTEQCTVFLKKILSVLQKTEHLLDWSPKQKKNFMPKLFAMVRRFIVSCFLLLFRKC